MTASELMERMSVEELFLWAEHDRLSAEEATKPDVHFALILASLESARTGKKVDPRKFLPKPRRRRKSLAEIKSNFMAAVVNSSRGPFHGGRG